jgi:CDP-diglyceride synthetase
MTNFTSRITVALVGVPSVLAVLWAGGWWLFALIALAALFALHEFWVMTRALRPLAAAGYCGAFLALAGAQIGGLEWMVGGFLATLPLAFLRPPSASARPCSRPPGSASGWAPCSCSARSRSTRC